MRQSYAPNNIVTARLITPRIQVGQMPIDSIRTISGAMTRISRVLISVR